HQLEQLDLPVEQLEDVGLDGSRSGEVHDVDLALLPYTVQPSNALLHHHRVPGQVVVHQHVAELQIASFAAGAGSDQHAARILVERANALVPLGRRVSARAEEHNRWRRWITASCTTPFRVGFPSSSSWAG